MLVPQKFFGRVGRLDMRFDRGDIKILENGIKKFIDGCLLLIQNWTFKKSCSLAN